MGSMAAGALTGAIFKSTGSSWSFSTDIFSHLSLIVSRHQTGHCCCGSSIRHSRNLELCEKERLIFLFLCIYNLNSSLIPALVSLTDLWGYRTTRTKIHFSPPAQTSGERWTDMAFTCWHTSRILDYVLPRFSFTLLVLVTASRESTINALAVRWLSATS